MSRAIRVGGIEMTYIPPKMKKYVAPMILNTALGLVMNQKGRITKRSVGTVVAIYIYKVGHYIKQKDLGKIIDLTINYSITIVCFYVVPHIVAIYLKGGSGIVEVVEILSGIYWCEKEVI